MDQLVVQFCMVSDVQDNDSRYLQIVPILTEFLWLGSSQHFSFQLNIDAEEEFRFARLILM